MNAAGYATDPARFEVYVWFEANAADDPLVRAAEVRLADTMLRGGSDPATERPALLRRPDTKLRDGEVRATWMEVWPAVPSRTLAGWLARLDAAALDTGATALARGGRHVEPFEIVSAPRGR